MVSAQMARRRVVPTLVACIALLHGGKCFVLRPTAGTAKTGGHRSSCAPPLPPRARCRAGVGRRGEGLEMMGGGKAAAAEAQVAEEKAEREALRVKNDQEWQFFDTARVNVKAGMGGNG